MDDKGRELCPRLIDYLVIVGRRRGRFLSQASIDVASSSSSHTVTAPELLRRYPTDDHKDFYLPTDVTVFCQPEGCVTKGIPKHSQSQRETSSFVFTLTEKDSAKIRHGICLNFLQSYEKARCATADNTIKPHNNRSRRRLDYRLSLTSLCLISHHPFLSTFRELLLLLKKLIDGCSQRLSEEGQYPKWVLPPNVLPAYEFALPDHTRFSFVDFPLHLPLELLGIDTAIRVLAAVMLESKV
ncbi:unnamed protein product, partial [Gongylonema pulchrum]|uniref:UDENN domain-containing protein n=1 Tax=Gongylonema pulchrum TaxID=637853 RepID=A0A183D692_9BILA